MSVIRQNVDSVDAMFEIAPFTCFSEFVDLEDFLIRNSNLEKFLHMSKENSHAMLSDKTFDKTAHLLYSSKLE